MLSPMKDFLLIYPSKNRTPGNLKSFEFSFLKTLEIHKYLYEDFFAMAMLFVALIALGSNQMC